MCEVVQMDASDDGLEIDAATPLTDRPAISRRTALHRLWILTGGAAALVAAETCGATLWGLYPSRANRFGGPQIVGRKSDFPAALPQECALNTAGVFYRAKAHAFIVHLSARTEFLLDGSALRDALGTASITPESDDGSYWLALYEACPHLGTRVGFPRVCRSFKCPSHGAHFHCDGEYLDGPSPRSMDRFPLRFEGSQVIVDTGQLVQSVARSEPTTRLLAIPLGTCFPE
jgi:cytochrome b6-f complex iron-sulfur subunit